MLGSPIKASAFTASNTHRRKGDVVVGHRDGWVNAGRTDCQLYADLLERIGHLTDAVKTGRMPSSLSMQASCRDEAGAVLPTAHRSKSLARRSGRRGRPNLKGASMATHLSDTTRLQDERWLKHYYFTRAAFSVVWVALAFAIGQHAVAIGAALLIVYPVWDALANYVDMSRSGGMRKNLTQALNVFASAAIAIAVIVVLSVNTSLVLDVFGVWAVLSGLLQLATAVRRWTRFGAQWAMILSGGQSALAGAFFIAQAHASVPPAILKVAGYAGVGAIYFLVSALWLSAGQLRRKFASTP
jgi:uncharacterized membrane protein HdeD (DUF308 family)